MAKKKPKQNVIYWVLQDNQSTPFIVDFLSLIASRTKEFCHLQFMVPEIHVDALNAAKVLKPIPFQVSSAAQSRSYKGYSRKRDLLGNDEFADGLAFYKALLLDDLAGGDLFQTMLHLKGQRVPKAIFLQLLTPLGSSEIEERIFYAWVHWAKHHGIPIVGYELLPLDTRWSLAPSLMDAIITMRQDSYNYLTSAQADIKAPVYLLPRYEGKIFSPATTHFWRNGLGTHYKYQNQINLDHSKTVLYLPHNVAMSYEYKMIVRHLLAFKNELHLMFSIGKDQVRGAHNHQQIIEILSREEVSQISHSFHDMNKPYEMVMADAVISAASCYGSCVASENSIPTIIYDPSIRLPDHVYSYKTLINTPDVLHEKIGHLIQTHKQRTEISRILFQLTGGENHG